MHLFEFMLQVCFPAAVYLHVLFLPGGGEGGGWLRVGLGRQRRDDVAVTLLR